MAYHSPLMLRLLCRIDQNQWRVHFLLIRSLPQLLMIGQVAAHADESSLLHYFDYIVVAQ